MDNRTPYNRAGPGQPIPSYDDWSLVHRGTMAPWGVYEKDGKTASGFAVPAMVTEPIEAGKRFLGEGGGLWQLPNKQNTEDAITLLFSFYGGQALKGTAAGAMSAKAANALSRDAGIFGGQRAATADLNALARAEKMAGEGASRDAIWQETGWFQGPDQKWRFEIDDSGMFHSIKPTEWIPDRKEGQPYMAPNVETAANKAMSNFSPTAPLRVKRLFSHPVLDETYPSGFNYNSPDYQHQGLMGMRVNLLNAGGPEGAFLGDRIAINETLPPVPAKSATLHELQHAIQRHEGFARGGNLGMFTPEEIAAERARVDTPDPNDWSGVGGGYGDAPDRNVAHGLYSRLAGEVEARNVQKRMNMSAEERRATPPWETQDIPYEDQIVRLLSDTGRPSLMGSALASQDSSPLDEILARYGVR